MKKMSVIILVLSMAVAVNCVQAGGEAPHKSTRKSTPKRVNSPEVIEAMQHTQAVTRALELTCKQAYEAVDNVARRYERLTMPVVAVPNRFGDPAYGFYGRRAYADSPMYEGPAYAASFEPGEWLVLPDSEFRAYHRQAYSHPIVGARTDVYLSPGATHSYVRSGMYMNPVSQAPSMQRVMMNNH